MPPARAARNAYRERRRSAVAATATATRVATRVAARGAGAEIGDGNRVGAGAQVRPARLAEVRRPQVADQRRR